MADISQFYTIWLKPGHLKSDQVTATIAGAEVMELHPRPGETKTAVVLSFVGRPHKLILNSGNANRMSQLHGNDTDAWPGLVIGLRRAKHGAKDTIILGEPPKTNGAK